MGFEPLLGEDGQMPGDAYPGRGSHLTNLAGSNIRYVLQACHS
ncbi:hypothetical protein DCCM_3840 [Desulfocucumis palustris]|uniref:Uncharacterized protein n=1 Tax=Desulfocucumis palustris TaxID=1898651 RepID=A0A2L2XEY4_9FIRM|nr:hypothetical protein DCCM_3840 [Desulfocucumis palustris]